MQNMKQNESVHCQLCFLKPDSRSARTLRHFFLCFILVYYLVLGEIVKYLLYSVSSVICSYNGSFLYAGFLTDNLVIDCKHTRWSHNCSVVFVYADMTFHKYIYLIIFFCRFWQKPNELWKLVLLVK
jgi:hypothetical protein